MLLIQNINLSWNKKERKAEYAKARRQFPLAYPLEKTLNPQAAVIHCLSFFQRGGRFIDFIEEMQTRQQIAHMEKHRLQFYQSVREVSLTNLSIRPCPKGVWVTFFYDGQRSGKPLRKGHNKEYHNPKSPFYCRDCLNETAFVLAEHQYGRIMWNERRCDYDTGEWYYELHIYNIISWPDEIPPNNIFVAKKPDYVYRQMALL